MALKVYNFYVILIELVENKGNRLEPVIAALKIAQTKYGLDIVNIASVYGKSNKHTKKGLHLLKLLGFNCPLMSL